MFSNIREMKYSLSGTLPAPYSVWRWNQWFLTDVNLCFDRGAAAGAGATLDVATRDSKVICLVEEDSTSRSTKLIWGGTRYLALAFENLFYFKSLSDPIKPIKDFRVDGINCHRERRDATISSALRILCHLTSICVEEPHDHSD